MNNGYVYFISDHSGHIKIGVTENVERRMKELQTGNASELTLVHLVVTDSMEDAFAIESGLHKMFSDKRLHGEWFEQREVLRLIKRPCFTIGEYRIKGMCDRKLIIIKLFITLISTGLILYIVR